MTTPDTEADWIPWTGGECPVPGKTQVRACYRDGLASRDPLIANTLFWGHYGGAADIIAYRVVEPAPEPAAVSCQHEAHDHPAHEWHTACIRCGVFRGRDLHATTEPAAPVRRMKLSDLPAANGLQSDLQSARKLLATLDRPDAAVCLTCSSNALFVPIPVAKEITAAEITRITSELTALGIEVDE